MISPALQNSSLINNVPVGVSTKNYWIVLCHGFMGTDSMAGINYFRGVRDTLEKKGRKVIVPKVSMTGSIQQRAKQLESEIDDWRRKDFVPTTEEPELKLHLICHSMGGLDARLLVQRSNELRFRVLSITTVSTPHRGSPIASLSDSLGAVSRLGCKVLLGLLSGSGQAMNDMTPRNMAIFNDSYKDVAGIKYYSVAAKLDPWINHILYASHKYIKKAKNSQYPEAFGDNDGMVSVNSAKWGEFLGVIEDHTSLFGVEGKDTSHFGVIGWGMLGIAAGDSNYDARGMYCWLVDNIARKVEGQA